jgi:hypothetical protein
MDYNRDSLYMNTLIPCPNRSICKITGGHAIKRTEKRIINTGPYGPATNMQLLVTVGLSREISC